MRSVIVAIPVVAFVLTGCQRESAAPASSGIAQAEKPAVREDNVIKVKVTADGEITADISVGVVVAFAVFVCAVIGDAWIRATQIAELSIAGAPIQGAEISGASMPDFLWTGRAWWIEVDTDKPLLLTLDDWTCRIPVGVHHVYSNHDHTNTGQYGDRDFWGFPETVSVRDAMR
jgi:hypothetical protein